jgi:hypothetical protein
VVSRPSRRSPKISCSAIFGFDPGQYLITDLSSLHDFVGVNDMEIGNMLTRIRDVYGLDVADLPSGNLLEIFRRRHDQQAGSRSDRTQ